MSEAEAAVAAVPPAPPAAEGPGSEFKRQGNEHFAAKRWDEAIASYTEAIKVDPENGAVYYSNRSACWFSKRKFIEAMEDALQCVDKDPKFVKGYLRLVSAQMELGKFEDAETTLKAALTLEPANELIGRKIKELRAKKQGSVAKKPAKQLTEEQRKELMELQEQHGAYNRDLRGVVMRASGLEREMRAVNVTANQLKEYDASVPLYKAVGKAYVLSSKDAIDQSLDKDLDMLAKNHKDLLDRKEYLERRIASSRANIIDLSQ